jgi:hypothetical protein
LAGPRRPHPVVGVVEEEGVVLEQEEEEEEEAAEVVAEVLPKAAALGVAGPSCCVLP